MSEAIKRDWRTIYDRKRDDGNHKKSGDFVAVIRVTYCDFYISEWEVEAFSDLDD